MYSTAEAGARVICLCPVSLFLLYSVHVEALALSPAPTLTHTQTHTYTLMTQKSRKWHEHVTHSSQIEWDDSQANKQRHSQTSTGGRSPNRWFSRKQAAQAHLRNQGRNYSCRRSNTEVKSRVLLSTAFRGGRQTSSGGAVIRHNQLIIPQVAKSQVLVCLCFSRSPRPRSFFSQNARMLSS